MKFIYHNQLGVNLSKVHAFELTRSSEYPQIEFRGRKGKIMVIFVFGHIETAKKFISDNLVKDDKSKD